MASLMRAGCDYVVTDRQADLADVQTEHIVSVWITCST